MQGYMRSFSEAGLESLLYLAGAGMSCRERQRSVHADMQLDGVAATDAACAQVVRVSNIGERGDNGEDFLLHLVGQRSLHQLVETLTQ